MTEPLLIPFLIFITGCISGWVGSQAGGGGGLILLPTLTLLGLPPHIALVVHRCGIPFGNCTAFLRFLKTDHIQWRLIVPLLVMKITAILIGVSIFLKVNESVLSRIIAGSLLLVLVVSVWKKSGIKSFNVSKKHEVVGFLGYFLVGIWGGIMSAGTGLIKIFVMIYGFGLTYLQASATDRLPSLIGSLVALVVFYFQGLIIWPYAIAVALGYGIGAHFGTRHTIKKGNTWVQKIVIILVLVSVTKLLLF